MLRIIVGLETGSDAVGGVVAGGGLDDVFDVGDEEVFCGTEAGEGSAGCCGLRACHCRGVSRVSSKRSVGAESSKNEDLLIYLYPSTG